ncbi:hypothetical protein ACTGVA_11680, partial [Streptococcus suis]
LRIGRRSLQNNALVALAAAAFVALSIFQMPFPLVVFGAGLIGLIGGWAGWSAFQAGGGHRKFAGATVEDADTVLGEGIPEHARLSVPWLLKVAAVGALVWGGPIL